MPKTPAKRVAARQAERVRQLHTTSFDEGHQKTRTSSRKRKPDNSFVAFVREFPWLTGIISVAIVVLLFTGLSANRLLPGQQVASGPDCSWAKNPAGYPTPSTIAHTYSKAPTNCIVKETIGLYTATIHTKKGDIALKLDQYAAPITTNNFIFLATHHFYDGISFHRVETGILQGGDPTTLNPKTDPTTYGQGGPGYTIKDEFPKDSTYFGVGCLSMAKTTAANSTGSQFFICTADDKYLQPQYNYFGAVYNGLDIAKSLQKGDIITSITIGYDKTGAPGIAPTPTGTPSK